jgi:hypothetical protein
MFQFKYKAGRAVVAPDAVLVGGGPPDHLGQVGGDLV